MIILLIWALEQKVESNFPKPQSCLHEEDGYLEKNPGTVTEENGGKLILVRQPMSMWQDLDSISSLPILTLCSDPAFYDYGSLIAKMVLIVLHP